MNGYARISELTADIAGTAGNADLTDTYVRAIEVASREADRMCDRHFYARAATRHFTARDYPRLLLDDDLPSVTSVVVDADGDGVFETTLTQGTDYWALPMDEGDPEAPPRVLELTPYGQLRGWPRGRRRVRVTGVWGYSQEVAPTGLTGTLTDASDTSLVCTAAAQGVVDQGEALVMGGEQLYVSAVSGAVLTVERGVNGTTAAAHSGVAISRRVYPGPVSRAVRMLVVRYRWGLNEGPGGGASFGDELVRPANFTSFGEVAGLLRPYRVVRFG